MQEKAEQAKLLSPTDSSSNDDPRFRTLTTKERFLYGFGDCAEGFPNAAFGFYLNPFLLDTALISAGYAATIVLVGRLWDAITDPIVGALSDRTRTRIGRRRPWLLLSAIPYGLLYFAVWQTPDIPNEGTRVLYYAFLYCATQTTWTCYLVPYSALALELSNDVHQRNKLVQYRMSFFVISVLAGAGILGALRDTIPNNADAYFVGAFVGVAFITFPILTTCYGLTERPPDTFDKPESFSLYARNTCQLLKNRAFVFLLLMYLCCYTALNLIQNNLVLYGDHVALISDYTTLYLMAFLASAFVCMPLCTAAMRKFGKKTVYFVGVSFYFPAFIGLYLLEPQNYVALAFVSVIAGVASAVALLVPAVMLPDVVDEDTLKTGKYREGMLYALFVFFQKASTALSLAFSTFLLEVAGYVNGAEPGTQPKSVELALRMLCGPVPGIFVAISFIFLYFYPLTTKVINQNTQSLSERRLRKLETPDVQKVYEVSSSEDNLVVNPA